MKYLYQILCLSAVISYFGLSYLAPIQEKEVAKRHAESTKSEWQKAEEACRKATSGNITTSRDMQGVIYCISSAGKLLATISEPAR